MDSEGYNTPMGHSGPHSKLKYLVGMGYEGGNDSRITIVHKGVCSNYIKLHWTKWTRSLNWSNWQLLSPDRLSNELGPILG